MINITKENYDKAINDFIAYLKSKEDYANSQEWLDDIELIRKICIENGGSIDNDSYDPVLSQYNNLVNKVHNGLMTNSKYIRVQPEEDETEDYYFENDTVHYDGLEFFVMFGQGTFVRVSLI